MPTYLPYEIGPIGYAYETEFEQREIEVGLNLDQMQDGVLVTGGSLEERFQTNLRLVYQAAMAEENYLIITTNKNWRYIMNLIPDSRYFRLGEELIFNPVDSEGGDPAEYTTLLAQVFAQAFLLSRLGFERLLEVLLNTPIGAHESPDLDALRSNIDTQIQDRNTPGKSELHTIWQFLSNLRAGRASRIFGMTQVPMHQLLNGITVLEIDLEVLHQVQFLLLCFLAKVLAHSHNNSQQRCIILIDTADSLSPMNPRTYRAQDIEHFLLDWIGRFQRAPVGLHLSMQFPSRFPPVVINSFRTVIAHRTTATEDVKVISDLLQFQPESVVHSKHRHHNHQVDYLCSLDTDKFLLKRPDITNTFPVSRESFDYTTIPLLGDESIQEHLNRALPGWRRPIHAARTNFERWFDRSELIIIQRILSLLQDYPVLQRHALLASLNSDPTLNLDLPELDRHLTRLLQLKYIKRNELDDGYGHKRYSYEISPLGLEAYEEYIHELGQRARRADSN